MHLVETHLVLKLALALPLPLLPPQLLPLPLGGLPDVGGVVALDVPGGEVAQHQLEGAVARHGSPNALKNIY